MSESALLKITINGKATTARPGQTVLEAAEAAGIKIPALCHHPHLKPEGCCRVCLVEIEKQRSLMPACTFPVFDGMVVQTESPKVVESRKNSLQLIFSERQHYCMFCAASGDAEHTDCELQRLGYQYGIDVWAYPTNYARQWGVDATRRFFVMDHARCILCRRCVRACEQVAANHTLGVQQRGPRTMICADDGVPFGESSCVSCGTCLQVCPTGALIERSSAYMGTSADTRRTAATCMGCAVACGIHAITRDNHLLKVEGDWEAGNGGLLCSKGRFEVVQPKPRRIVKPMVREGGRLVETGWDTALSYLGARLKEHPHVAGLASPRLTNESLAAFACFFQEVLESSEVGLLYGQVPPLDLGEFGTLADVARADCIIIIGGDPLEDQKVVGYLVKRGFDNDAKLIVVNDESTPLEPYARSTFDLEDISHHVQSPFERLRTTYHLRVSGISQLKQAAEEARRPVVLYGAGLSTTVYAALRALPDKVKFLPLIKGTNAAGAARLGLEAQNYCGEAMFLMLGDDTPEDVPMPKAQFTVVAAAYESPWTAAADVVLPAQTWAEQRGHLVNMEGRNIPISPLLEAPKTVLPDYEVLMRLSVRMGHAMSYQEIADISMAL